MNKKCISSPEFIFASIKANGGAAAAAAVAAAAAAAAAAFTDRYHSPVILVVLVRRSFCFSVHGFGFRENGCAKRPSRFCLV